MRIGLQECQCAGAGAGTCRAGIFSAQVLNDVVGIEYK